MILLLILMTSCVFSAIGQDSLRRKVAVKPVSTRSVQLPVFDKRGLVIDSLSSRLELLTIRLDSLLVEFNSLKRQKEERETELLKVNEENKKLSERLEESQGDNLQSSHTNSILFIFNVGVGIFLLIALIWMFMRKGSEESSKPLATARKGTNGEEYFDSKLERIQKLGSLRDKGLLTDEEFNLQKKQILGE